MAKKKQKKSLVAKRLSMLDDHSLNLDSNPVSEETPLQLESPNPVKDEDSPCDSNDVPIPSSRSANGTSNKRAMVVSDESEEDVIQPIKKERGSSSEEKLSTSMDRATMIQASLSSAYPSFIKLMLPSHVSGGFWLHLSAKFCEPNLPKDNCTIVLVDEAGIEFNTCYLAYKYGLSGGWRAFSIHHELQKGDVLVFHLIHPTTFKVYIVREHRLDEVDGALGLLGLDNNAGLMVSEDNFQKVLHVESNPPLDSESPSNSDSEVEPEVLDVICSSDSSNINFEAVKDFENFNIIVDNLVIDSKLSDANRKKYYELCFSQNSFLHEQLLQGLNCDLVVGMILEIINISDAIKACSSLTSIEDLQIWKTTLNGFELLGMKVNFLCTKLNQMLDIALEIHRVDASNRSNKYSLEQAGARTRMQALEVKITDLKDVMEMIDLEIEAEMTATARKHETKFKEVSNISW